MKSLKTGDPDIDEAASKKRNWVLSILWVAIPTIVSTRLIQGSFFLGLATALAGFVILSPVVICIFCKMNNRIFWRFNS